MAWLAKLDAKTEHWPTPARWSYHGLRWLLIGLGAFACAGLAYNEFHEGRIGLGLGVVGGLTAGVIKGVLLLVTPPRPPQTGSGSR